TAYKRSLQVSLAIEDRVTAGMVLANMSLLANVLGESKSSGEYADSALRLFRMIGSDYQQPFPLRMLAYSALQNGDIESAQFYIKESLNGNIEIDHKIG
ncbi:MAG TPA: hypothetical protein DCX53_05825, partial [Anaerolineae bacterium]|nr:hypothetical protein [Anaerolineae bacterium]